MIFENFFMSPIPLHLFPFFFWFKKKKGTPVGGKVSSANRYMKVGTYKTCTHTT